MLLCFVFGYFYVKSAKLLVNCLQMSRILANIAYKLCVELIVIRTLILKIKDVCNFFNSFIK